MADDRTARHLPGPLPDRIETPRLILRPYRVEDIGAFAPLVGDWAVARWLANVPHPYGPADAREWIDLAEEYRIDRRALALLVATRDDDRGIGGIEVNLETSELGYWIGVPFQGRGYASEAVAAALRVAFAELGLARLCAAALPDNGPSRRVLEKAGFEHQGLHDYDFGLRGGLRPGRLYALTAVRWRALNGEDGP